MTFYDAFAAADPAFHWNGDLAARFRDILKRRVAPFGERVEALAHLIERGIENSLPLDGVKSSLSALVSALRRRGVEGNEDATSLAVELAEFFRRIEKHGEGQQIESYSSYLFTVEFDVTI